MNKKILLSLLLVFVNQLTFAAEDTDYEGGFDSLVKELTQSRSTVDESSNIDPFDLVKIHFGIGVVNTLITFDTNKGLVSGGQHGFQASLGIDLFSPNWVAEGVVRSFAEVEMDQTWASLHEFDLKIAYQSTSRRFFNPFLGLGMAARYLDLKQMEKTSPAAAPTKTLTQHSTPSSVIFTGISYPITDGMSLAAEISYRKPIIDETIERSAADFTIRFNTHF